MSALPPSAAIVREARQINLAPSGNVSNSFSAARIHETGRVLRIIGRPLLYSPCIAMLSYLTTPVKKAADQALPLDVQLLSRRPCLFDNNLLAHLRSGFLPQLD